MTTKPSLFTWKSLISVLLVKSLILGLTWMGSLTSSHAVESLLVSTHGIGDYKRPLSYPTDLTKLSDGTLLVVDQAAYAILKVQGNQLTPFASLNRRFPSLITGDEPCGIEANSLNEIFVVNCNQTRIFKFDSRGSLVNSFPISLNGVTDRGFDWGGGMAIDANSNIYLSDEKNHVILRVNTKTEVTEVLAGKIGVAGTSAGFRTEATFNLPRGLAVDKNGNVFVADTLSRRIRMIDPAGNVTTNPRDICQPIGMTFDEAGNLIVVSEFFCGAKITRVLPDGTFQSILDDSILSVGPVAYALVGQPKIGSAAAMGVELVKDSNNSSLLVLTDGKNGSIKFFDSSGSLLRTIGALDVFGVAKSGTSNPIYNFPHTIFPLNDGTSLVIDNGTIRQISSQGKILKNLHLPFVCSSNAALWDDGTLFCRDGSKIMVRFPDNTTTEIGTNTRGFKDGNQQTARFDVIDGMTFSGQTVYASDLGNHAVRKITRNGAKQFEVSTYVSGNTPVRPDFSQTKSSASFSYPSQIAVSKSGTMYVAEGGWDRLRKIDSGSQGLVQVTAGNFKSWPTGIVVDANETVLVITERGYLYRLESNSLVRLGGDGTGVNDGPISGAKFFRPHGMAIDFTGNLLIADSENHVIRKIENLNLVPTLIYDREKLAKLLSSMTAVTPVSNTQTGSNPGNATPPTKPNTPKFSGVNFAGNTINIAVNIGSSSASRPDKVLLVAPKLGISAIKPLEGRISGDTAQWSIDFDQILAGTMIPLEIVGEKNGEKSDPLVGAYQAPNLVTKVSQVPPQPKNFKSRVVGSSALITAEVRLVEGALATDAFLYGKSLGITKTKAIKGDVIGSKIVIEVPLKASMAGKKYLVTLYLSNAKGESQPLNSTLSIPAAPKVPSIPSVLPPKNSNTSTVICVRSTQTRAFAGSKCPPGWVLP